MSAKRYLVTLRVEETASAVVEASSKREAEQKAREGDWLDSWLTGDRRHKIVSGETVQDDSLLPGPEEEGDDERNDDD